MSSKNIRGCKIKSSEFKFMYDMVLVNYYISLYVTKAFLWSVMEFFRRESMQTILIFTKFLSDPFGRPLDFMALNWMMHNFTGCENVLCSTWHYRCRIFCFNQFYATLWLYLTSETIVLWTIILSQWKSLRQNALSHHFAKNISDGVTNEKVCFPNT